MLPPSSRTSSDHELEELPYNPKNRLLEPEDVNYFLSRFGITLKMRDISIYRKAFINKSYCTRKNENFLNGNEQCPPDCIPLQEESNERYEFLGDSILNFVVGNYLYDRYPYENEGFLTKMRTKIVNGEMCAHLSRLIGLQPFMLLSKQIEDNDGRNNRALLEDTFESFIAAIYIDFNQRKLTSTNHLDFRGIGFQVVERWMVNMLEDLIDFGELVVNKINHKDALIKYFQNNFQKVPVFLEMNVTGKHNAKKTFTVCINHENRRIAVGDGETKRQAENDASRKALEYFGVSQS
jgi:ribonuclease-3